MLLVYEYGSIPYFSKSCFDEAEKIFSTFQKTINYIPFGLFVNRFHKNFNPPVGTGGK